MSTSFKQLCPAKSNGPEPSEPLFLVADIRVREATAIAELGPNTLMERAGMAIAKFALAIAPHAQRIWVPCGPGNNGGDGLIAAVYLRAMGKTPIVTMLPSSNLNSTAVEARDAHLRAKQCGVLFQDQAPQNIDLCIDALFGIGSQRPFCEQCIAWIAAINTLHTAILSVDVPTGLHSDSGNCAEQWVKASHTLTLLAAKPGLFMGSGRDACGEIWLNSLEVASPSNPVAALNAPPTAIMRPHNSHKGSFGDVAIVGGAHGMGGAAILAATAALRAGAGRVFVGMLCNEELTSHNIRPELMLRAIPELPFECMTVIAGCGGGTAIETELPLIIQRAFKLVLDADALNAIANDPALEQQVRQRHPETTVITPHPLEAAKLLGVTTEAVQNNRLQSARTLANRFGCTVVLKGSGTVIADGIRVSRINLTGDARLSTAGTGDVLAGIVGANLASGTAAFEAACAAVSHHGSSASRSTARNLPAQELINSL